MRESPTRRRILAALAATTSLAGCPSGPSTEPPPSTNTPQRGIPTVTPAEQDPTAEIHVYTDFGGENWTDMWTKEIIPAFDSESPANVQFEVAGGPRDYIEHLLEAGSAPEIAHGTIRQHGEWIATGETIPVDDLVADLEAANGALHATEPVRVDGDTYLVPYGWTLGGTLNYRSDIYERLGLSVPETWNELLENARAIDDAENVDARGFALPLQGLFARRLDNDFTNWLYTAGGDWWRWMDEADAGIALDFQHEHVRAALDMMAQLGRYSPDPGEYSYSNMFRDWIEGNIAQCVNPNAWLAGIAFDNGAEEIALHTKQAIVPIRDRTLDPPTRGWSAMDGAVVFTRADNHQGARALLRFVHEGPERQAAVNLVRPMRWIPPYKGIMETETYQNSGIFRAHDGHFLDLNRRLLASLGPYHRGERPQNPAALYARSFREGANLVLSVLRNGEPADEKIDEIQSRLSSHLSQAPPDTE